VENAMAIFVGTPDGGRFRASIVGMPNKADIALLRISPKADLPAVPFGDSDKLRVGDTVIAIGSPFGFDNSVTAGIVSSVNRNIMESPFDDYIQTDAAINHGNSGGPLFNLQGQVIGMNSVLYAPGDYSGSAGVAFAIPSNDLHFVYNRLEQYGEVRAGMLPIRTQQVTGLMAQALGMSGSGGALVISLQDHSEAMKGAIQPGDIIQTFNGETVLDPRDLARKAAKSPIGSTAQLQIYHRGKVITAAVPILAYDQTSKPPPEPARAHIVGLKFDPAPNGQQGVVVSAIDRLGSAADSGLQQGDLIVQVQDQLATSPDAVNSAISARQKAGAAYCALLIERDKQRSWIPVGLPQ
jgi:serine protease Do